MHACGHDGHMAILLGTAKVLAGMRKELPGTVMFIFQPAEEGAPDGERGGASLMIDEGVLDIARPEAIFGLHLFSSETVGTVGYRSGPMMAGSDIFRIVVHGKQTHGARPWLGVDPIVTASQIVLGLQTIVSRQLDISSYPAILTIGMINGGVRNNIIPDKAELGRHDSHVRCQGARGSHRAHQAHRDADRGIGRGDGGVSRWARIRIRWSSTTPR